LLAQRGYIINVPSLADSFSNINKAIMANYNIARNITGNITRNIFLISNIKKLQVGYHLKFKIFRYTLGNRR
jgi:hypothetical protein